MKITLNKIVDDSYQLHIDGHNTYMSKKDLLQLRVILDKQFLSEY